MIVLDLILGALGLALGISVTVLVHELAHLIVARIVGLPVARFSVGFGPALWAANWHGIEVRIGAFPVGGFVGFDDADPRWQNRAMARAVMYAAGPFASLLLAVFLLAAVVLFSNPEQGVSGALLGALGLLGQLVVAVASGLAAIASDLNGICDLSGPVEALSISTQVVAGGPVLYLGMIGILSAGIACFNLLPLPVLDGGQIIRALLEAATGLRMSGTLLKLWTATGLTAVVMIGWLALLGDVVC